MTDWREELIEKMALQISRAQFGDWVINPTEKTREQARAALAVAEPVIREQCAKEIDDYRMSYGGNWPALEILAAAIREVVEASDSETPMRRSFSGGDDD